MPIQAVEPRRLYRQIADQLRQLIESGEFAVGDRLPTERELADQLGISRPTVREALIALEVEGRIRIRVGSGIYVTEPPRAAALVAETDEGPFELLRAREFIEGAIAAEAALHVQPADLELLDDVLRRMEDTSHPTKVTIALDREFHTTVAGILGNAVLARFIGELFDQRMNPYFELLSSYFENRESWQAAAEEHRAVRDAIAARDPERAKAAMQEHLRLSQLRFSRNFGERSVAREVTE
ncbi:FadR/GntR family transcriptional regulator [Allomesorhizobium camelthorni]|uniref:FadR family transcriptional regulator n=1 Tax=Allomesorhizobium camelthorni TaxID=475069 RepID=A0A6G4WGS3_9HYPH|nr:FadR/GntR family transcriptional regulator [Mesorhizobium camelthorni]NGO53297.1 FadR family transcriptional regulator [Mesorhizobium camelthorni]